MQNDNDELYITALKENSCKSWSCCLEHSGIKANILSFLERIFKNKDIQNRYVSNGIIRTDFKLKNSNTKYNIIYKRDNNSTSISPILLYPMPCSNQVCLFNCAYNQYTGH